MGSEPQPAIDSRTAVFIVPEQSGVERIEQWAAVGGCIVTNIRSVDRFVVKGKTILPDPGNQFFLADIVLTEEDW